MKKLLSCIFVMGLMTFAACSSDDNNDDDNNYTNCVTCAIAGNSNAQICEGENGNAYYSDIDTGQEYNSYIADLNCN